MSYLTDRAREESAAAKGRTEVQNVPGQMFEEILQNAQIQRRTLLRGSFGASLAAMFSGGLLSACGGGDDTPAPAESYAVGFKRVTATIGDTVVVPEGYTVDVMFSAGDAVVAGATAFTGSFLTSAQTEQIAGGNHDGMHFYPLPGTDANKRGLLAINHELPDYRVLFASGSYTAGTATAEDKKIALSAVGVSVIEVQETNGKWALKADSAYNKRYTGNTVYEVRGPAASAVGATVVGTLNNCSSGATPWGTYLTCEETTDNYIDPTQPEMAYGWVVEIDPYNELNKGTAIKRTALGRFDHENTAYMLDANNDVAIYMGDDGTPGCIYKFVPNNKYNPANRAANANLLDDGTLYAAKFNADGTGQWIALVQGQNGLVVGATDPGNVSQGTQTPVTVDFATQADVLVNTKSAARVAGATLMDRPEWITVGPDKKIYVTLTNNGSRTVTDAANPRVSNSHGHIVTWVETGNSPRATTFQWSIFLLAGDSRLAPDNLKGNINGDTFSSPDGIRVDPQGRLWVQTDAATGTSITNTFGNNAMYYVDQTTKASTRFLVGPNGCEITGLAYTPDLKTFFVNIQHPTGTWPSNVQGNTLPPRSSTIVVRRTDGKPVGA